MSEKMTSPFKKLRLDSHDDPKPTNKPANSPISMLTDDVLFFIFSINSVMEMIPFNKETTSIMLAVDYEEDILTTNRYSSQVCRRWRNIMLSSPTIWANSLNIDELDQEGDEWRWEVLDRTGNAPLTLIGRIEYTSSVEGNHVKDFIQEILENDWGRMRYFSLCTHDPDIKEYIFYAMREPAPLLEHFLYWTTKSEDDEYYDSWTPPRRNILFEGYSPKLTFFCCDGVTYNFSQGALSNLRQLWLGEHRATFTIPELYRGLCHLPLLEELNIDHHELLGDVGVGLGESTPTLSLPRLADITIHKFGKTFVSKLIKYISPARACRLVVSDWTDPMLGVGVRELSQVYATFIREYADFEFIPYLSFMCHQKSGFSLCAATARRTRSTASSPSTYPNISFEYQSDGHIGESSNLDIFSAPVVEALASRTDLGHVTKINLTLDEAAIIRSQGPQILELLKNLGSVVHLTTDVPTLRVLVDAQVALGLDFVLFPNLTTIVVTGEANSSHDLGAFLDGRSKSGNPIKFLDLPKNSYSNDGRWKSLNDISGLSVVWSDPLNFYYPGEYQFVELNGALVPANTITSTNLG